MPTESETGAPYCSFCGKSHHQVKMLIAGPEALICDECVALCIGILVSGGVDAELLLTQIEGRVSDIERIEISHMLKEAEKKLAEEQKRHEPFLELKRALEKILRKDGVRSSHITHLS